jgi:hypothetical protein
MPKESNDLPPPVNHIFVDYENVCEVDPAIIGQKTVHLTLLLGAQRAKLDATVVEKLLQHAATVKLLRLESPGRNALDFTLAYYHGRAVLADPSGYFHIVSKDTGYDPLIEHLRSKHIRARRHEAFTKLTFSAPARPPAASAPAAISVAKPAANPTARSRTQVVDLEAMEVRVLEHLRKPTTKRPGTSKKLVSYLLAHLGNKLREAEAFRLVELLGQAGHLVIDDKGKVTYHLDHP